MSSCGASGAVRGFFLAWVVGAWCGVGPVCMHLMWLWSSVKVCCVSAYIRIQFPSHVSESVTLSCQYIQRRPFWMVFVRRLCSRCWRSVSKVDPQVFAVCVSSGSCCAAAASANVPWLVLSVFEASVLSARTRLVSLVFGFVRKACEFSNAVATCVFCWWSAVGFACSRMLSASWVDAVSWSGCIVRDVRMCLGCWRYGTSRMSSKSRRAKLCSRVPLRIWLSVRPCCVLRSCMMVLGWKKCWSTWMTCCGVRLCAARSCTSLCGIFVDVRRCCLSCSVTVVFVSFVVLSGCVCPWFVHWWPKRSGSILIAMRSSMIKVPEPRPLRPCAYFMAANRSRVMWRKQSSSWLWWTASRMVCVRFFPFGWIRPFWFKSVSWVVFGAIHAMSGWIMSAWARAWAGDGWIGSGGQWSTVCWRWWVWR